MSDVQVVWSRRLRPKWKGVYPAVAAALAVVGFLVGWSQDRSDRPRRRGRYAEIESVQDVVLFGGVCALMIAVVTFYAWAPRATLGRDGRLRYRAVLTKSEIDLRSVGEVVVTASPVSAGKRGGIGRWVMEVRTPEDAAKPRPVKLTFYKAPPGVIGIAGPPLVGEEFGRFVSVLSSFTKVTLDDEWLEKATAHGQKRPAGTPPTG